MPTQGGPSYCGSRRGEARDVPNFFSGGEAGAKWSSSRQERRDRTIIVRNPPLYVTGAAVASKLVWRHRVSSRSGLSSRPDASAELTSPAKESSSRIPDATAASAPWESPDVDRSGPVSVVPVKRSGCGGMLPVAGPPEANSADDPSDASAPTRPPGPLIETPLPPVPTPTTSVSTSPPLAEPGPVSRPPAPLWRFPSCSCDQGWLAPGSAALVLRLV